jgi:hypothetical protein
MSIGSKTGDLVKLVVVVAAVYFASQWYFGADADNGVEAMAEANCLRDVRNRFDAQSVRVSDVSVNSRGFVVRASVTTEKRSSTRVRCLTNDQGWVDRIEIIEH